jgi:hypothetical protein
MEKFDTVKILIEVRRRESDDALYSNHRPLTPGDQERMGTWPSGGLVHIAHAMMVECFRREAYTMAISILSKGRRIEEIEPKDIDDAVRVHMLEMMDKFLEGAAIEAHGRILGSLAVERDKMREAFRPSSEPGSPSEE